MSRGQRILRAVVKATRLGPPLVRRKSGLLVLMYHSIHSADAPTEYTYSTSVRTFRKQIEFLTDVASFVTLDDVFSSGAESNESSDFRVHVTFDDGYKNTLTNANPILDQYDVPSTIFLTTEFVEAGYESFLGWDDLGQFDSELVTFGSHCRHHVNLTAMSEDDAWTELRESKKTIESKAGTEVRYLSYPGGGFDDRVQRLAERAGYRSAFSDRLHFVRDNNDPYAFGRMSVDGTNEDIETFVAAVGSAPSVEFTRRGE